MSNKLSGNVLWESSRMMLPEHKEAINSFNQAQKIKQKAELDEQRVEEINRALQQSMRYRIPLCIRLYDPLEELTVVGVIEAISSLYGRFRVGDDWFMLDDIETVEVDEEPC